MKFFQNVVLILLLLVCGSVSAQWKHQESYWGPQGRPAALDIKPNVRITWTIEADAQKPPEKFYNYSVTYNCRSRHDTGDKPNTFNQMNPCLGITKHFDVKVLGIEPYITYLHVFENSRDGKLVIKGPGGEACWLKGQDFDLCFGATYAWIDYEDGRRGLSAHGKAKVPHIAFKRGAHAIVLNSLGKKDVGISIRSSFN